MGGREERAMMYAIVVRHNGFIDRMLRGGVSPDVPDMATACVGPDDRAVATYKTEAAAVADAARWSDAWGSRGYRFTVAERVDVPMWRIVHPQTDRERRLVGYVEQL
jgi:hypothetical protein